MAKAIAEVRNGSSVKVAGEKYNIAQRTLGNKISGKTPENRKMVIKPSTENEEERLVNWIIEISRKGFSLVVEDILNERTLMKSQEKRGLNYL
ncbi:hypothetical protein WA026_004135 [Henosepilachna vigintioctopunctata]|uniref:HTH psq-type domain-containing protein n=1 Tax=Henosepilachna vigintioctopunctata TaxID=420089 RepID=A0AAW1UIP6_9CUCU